MKNITVYLGSKTPTDSAYLDACESLGKALAQKNLGLIYGGANVGSMKVLADASLQNGGTVIGVIPQILLEKEILHPQLSKTYLVSDMRERKAKMMELGDGFIALPGGCGTMEEIFEVITWAQIGIHNKPYMFLNIEGFYDGIKAYMKHAHELGFISDYDFSGIHFPNTVDEALKILNI